MTRALRATAADVLNWSSEAVLADILADHLRRKTPRRDAEARSWSASLPLIAQHLIDLGLDRVEMLLEYRLPAASSRADVILCGVDPDTGADTYVVVELKQWSAAELEFNSDRIVRATGLPGEQLHPIDQVRGYCKYLTQYLEVLHDQPRALHGVAYLHNATESSISSLRARQPDQSGRMYTADGREDFLGFLAKRLAPKSGAAAAEKLLKSPIRPRADLISFTASELRQATEYSLLDAQEIAYRRVIDQVRLSHRQDGKGVVIVTGGPGSGKSLIAITLLAELHREGKRVQHATGSQAFTESLRKFPAAGSSTLKKLFQFYRTFAKYEKNELDVLICDEAHRIRAVSTNRFSKQSERTGRPQVDELIAAANVPVFLLDEHQVVRPGEVGTYREIHDHATRAGCRVHHVELDGLFRCGGSEDYEEWVRRLLGLRVGGPTFWTGDPNFEVLVAESPQQMQDFLRAKDAEGQVARMTAGYCWPWSDPNPDGSLVDDVRIGSWSMPWNLKSDRSVNGIPSRLYWATEPAGIDQIGCVYTAQGFEFDWTGVIIGPDLVSHNRVLKSVRAGNLDKAMRAKDLFDQEFDRLIRNIYKVLLTRGMKGVVLYATDPDTQELLVSLAPGLAHPEVTSPRIDA
ncbi:DNA/RNA helicase domain-containing protein [Nocardia asteroides]|uniref:DNA/RNA helicase domain-containing protein n=1 Tax=Nocardia asteroides TaxID=1824 RepID=UPI0033CE3AB5